MVERKGVKDPTLRKMVETKLNTLKKKNQLLSNPAEGRKVGSRYSTGKVGQIGSTK